MSENRKPKTKALSERSVTVKLYFSDVLWITGIGLMFVISFELFYRMIVKYNGCYPSDIPAYTHRVVTNGEIHTRFVESLFQLFYNINHDTAEMNVYLATVIAVIIIVNFIVVRYYLKRDGAYNSVPRRVVQATSFIALFTGPIYFPVIHEWYYLHSFATFAWHSPTQQTMTLFTMIAALCFLAMYLNYENGISVRWWFASALTSILAASAKPSAIIDFIPSMVILFLVELFSDGIDGARKKFSKLFIMGCALIPAGLYIIWLHSMEFGDVNKDGEEHHVIIGLKVLLSHKDALTAFTFGLTFAIAVFAVNYKRFKESKYFFALLLFLTGFIQWSFVTESGDNAKHGNFDWGMMFGGYFLTLICFALLLENIYDKESIFDGNQKKRGIYFIVIGVILVLSVLSQINYFMLILSGRSYMR